MGGGRRGGEMGGGMGGVGRRCMICLREYFYGGIKHLRLWNHHSSAFLELDDL